MYEFVINSDRKTISQRLLYILYPVLRAYSTIFQLKKGFKHLNLVESFYSAQVVLTNPPKKLNRDLRVCSTNLKLKPPAIVDFP
jgi:hypothetical protein